MTHLTHCLMVTPEPERALSELTTRPGRWALLRQRMAPNPADPPRRWLRRHWPWVSLMALAIVLVGFFDAWLGSCGFTGCPTTAEVRSFRPAEGGQILDRNSRFLGRLAAVARVNVPLSAVPQHVQQAFVATEDRRFYKHHGVDWRGFLRSAARNVMAGGVREGFSTITMQVAHNTFLQSRYHGRSFKRKLIELRLARIIESALTKDQILELYLNVIYLGNGMYGVEAASRDLFGKSISDVSLNEGALLAGLPKAPSVYNPRNSERRAKQRRNVVLGLMAQQGYISEQTAERAQALPVRVADTEWRPTPSSELLALDAVRAFVDSVLPDVLKEGDVTVYTTLDYQAQKSADRAIIRHAQAIGRGIQGVLVAMDPQTGDLRALVGASRLTRGGFNRAFRAKRQPGSAFKPFVYETALAAGYAPSTYVDDEPIEVMIGNKPWTPENYDNEYMGRVTFKEALEHSLNAATVRVSQTVGPRAVVETAHRNGIVSPLDPVPSIALGALEVTPVELVAAYAPFANGGFRVQPRLVRRIEAPDGTVLWSSDAQRTPVMDPRIAYEMTSMLRAVVDFGTGRPIRDAGIEGPVAGKTGTTNSGNDVWFVGFTPTLVAGVWFGYDTPRPIAGGGASGGRYAAPAWADFYQAGWQEPRNSDWLPPDGMVPRIVDPQTGQLATDYCPRRERDWFKPGEEPTEACHLHSAPPEEMYPLPGDSQIHAPDPIERAGRGLGKILRQIFKW